VSLLPKRPDRPGGPGAARRQAADARLATARLAREVHDGLSQDLWLAKLKQGRLARMPDLSPTARGLTTDNDRRNGAIRNFILNTNQLYANGTMKKVVVKWGMSSAVTLLK